MNSLQMDHNLGLKQSLSKNYKHSSRLLFQTHNSNIKNVLNSGSWFQAKRKGE